MPIPVADSTSARDRPSRHHPPRSVIGLPDTTPRGRDCCTRLIPPDSPAFSVAVSAPGLSHVIGLRERSTDAVEADPSLSPARHVDCLIARVVS